MAHGDYDCCAVCDRKMAYNAWEARTKEEVCPACAVALTKHGVEAWTSEQLVGWITSAPPADVLRILAAVYYRPCFYGNEVDDAVRLITPTPSEAPDEV
jgi:hypothetical protein